METNFYKVEISAETKEEADDILNALLQQKLVTGGQILGAPARFLWSGKITDVDYFMINSFTIERHLAMISEVVLKISSEQVPMVTFLPMKGNKELTKWISDTVG